MVGRDEAELEVSAAARNRVAHQQNLLRLISVDPTKKDLEDFAKLVEEGELIRLLLAVMFPTISAGKVKPLVDSVYSFEDALKAYERLQTGRATGKVVVKVDPTAS